MKTTLDIPEKLLAEAMKAAGAATKRETFLRALEGLRVAETAPRAPAETSQSENPMTLLFVPKLPFGNALDV